MAQQTIQTTDTLNEGRVKINDNFDELYIGKELLLAQTGFASYADNAYTSGSPFVLTSGVNTLLVNRAKTIVDSQIPIDIKTFYCPTELVVSGVTGAFVEGEVITGGTSGATGTLKEISSLKYRITNLTGDFTTTETITGVTSGATATVSSKKNALITGRDGDNLDIMLYFKAVPSASNSELDIWINVGGSIGELYRQTIYFRGTTEKGVIYNLPSAYTLSDWEANGAQVYIRATGANFKIYSMNFNFDRSHKAR